MAGNKLFEEQLHLITPHTYNALTKLVMAMSGVVKNLGKKTGRLQTLSATPSAFALH
jgi:hypothetical protein